MIEPSYEIDYEKQTVTVFRLYGTERADEKTVAWKWIRLVEYATKAGDESYNWNTMTSDFPFVAWRVLAYRAALDQLKEEGHVPME